MTPLVKRSPEEAAAHSAAASAPNSNGYDGSASWDSGSHTTSFAEVGTHAAPPLPPTTFAEAQFGEAPSAAAGFASTADAPSTAFAQATPSGAFSTAPTAAPSAFAAPEIYSDPQPSWSDAPVPAPPGWATAAQATPPTEFGYEPGRGAPDPIAPAFEAVAPELAAVTYPSSPVIHEMPAELAAPDSEVALEHDQPAGSDSGVKRRLPRWAVPGAALAVVMIGGGVYLAMGGGSDTGSGPAPVVARPTVQPAARASVAVAPPAVAVAPPADASVTPVARLAKSAPTGYNASSISVVVPAARLAAMDSIHRASELSAAGVTSATARRFKGPGGVTVTTLIETAASPAQANDLMAHARHLGFTTQAANGDTVYTLHSVDKPAAVVAAFAAWSKALAG